MNIVEITVYTLKKYETNLFIVVIVETIDGSLLPPPLPPKPLEKQTRIQANNGSSPGKM